MLSYYLPAPGRKRGGIERVAHELANGLAARGHEVAVWSYDVPPIGANYRAIMLPWRKFASAWLGQRLIMGYLGNLIPLLLDFDGYDVVLAHGDSLLLPMRGKPALRIMHGSALGEALSAKSPARAFMQLGVYLQELLTAATQSCVAVSENTRKYNPFLQVVIPNGVAIDRLTALPPARSAYPSILFVGALSGRKRGSLLVRWFAERVRPHFPSAKLTVVGEVGPSIEGVSYRVGIDDEELTALYRSAWVYASPSTYEGFGLPYLEAMASGTPVIASPNPGSREVLRDGVCGIIASDAEFPGAICALLGDELMRARLAEKGLARAAECSLGKMLDRYEELIYTLAGC